MKLMILLKLEFLKWFSHNLNKINIPRELNKRQLYNEISKIKYHKPLLSYYFSSNCNIRVKKDNKYHSEIEISISFYFIYFDIYI